MTTQALHRTAARPNSLNPARRFSVRLALATGATLATLLGSQTLSLLETPAPASGAASPAAAAGTANSALSAGTDQALVLPSNAGPKAPAAPLLVIVRNSGAASSVIAAQKGNASLTPAQSSVIEAPAQSAFSAPAPVIIAPALMQPMPFTRSSR